MKTRLLLTLLAVGTALTLAYARVQPAVQRPSGAEAAIKAAAESYVAAFNRGDLDGVLAIWSNHGEYIDDEGNLTHGKPALAERFKASMAEMKGWKLNLEGRGVRLLAPGVAVADGVAELTSPDGEKERSHYTTIWTETGGQWQLSSVRDLAAAGSDVQSGAELLKELDWLIGAWRHESQGNQVSLTCKRALNHFLLFEYTIQSASGNQEVKQYLGYDPRAASLHSWTFDSAGGFGEGLWSRRGKVWRCRMAGVLPSGHDGESTNSIKPVDAGSFIFKSEDRFVGDAAMPDVEIKFTRTSAK
jgi:uncharacterized protein (TIGR02246 family)